MSKRPSKQKKRRRRGVAPADDIAWLLPPEQLKSGDFELIAKDSAGRRHLRRRPHLDTIFHTRRGAKADPALVAAATRLQNNFLKTLPPSATIDYAGVSSPTVAASREISQIQLDAGREHASAMLALGRHWLILEAVVIEQYSIKAAAARFFACDGRKGRVILFDALTALAAYYSGAR